jgi:pSer/pThr/pTyr-binding forkhead associated (FHA) protein
MEIFVDGTVANFWNGTWLPLIGFAVTTIAALLVLWRAPLTMTGMVSRAVVILAVLATGPLAFFRGGLRVAVGDFELVIFLSILGSVTAAALGVRALFTRARPFTLAGRQVGLNTFVGAVNGTPSERTQVQSPRVAAPVDESATQVSEGPQPLLTVVSGTASGQEVKLSDQRRITIGRSSDNDVVIDDPAVSRHHAEVAFESGMSTVHDLGSSNGTIVDGERVMQGNLVAGTSIKIGNSLIEFRSPSAAAPSANSTQAPVQQRASDPTGTVVRTPKPSALAWLVVKSGMEQGRSFDLCTSSYSVGRDANSGIVLTDHSVSREHAIVQFRNGGYVINDVGSRGGTSVNGKSVSGVCWSEGAPMRIGETQLSLVGYQAANAPPTPDRTFIGSTDRAGAMVLVQEGPDAGSTFHLADGNNVIGRDDACAVRLSDETISRQHCVVQVADGKVTVLDLGSSSGTKVNNAAISAGYKLGSGDAVRIGKVELEFVAVAL